MSIAPAATFTLPSRETLRHSAFSMPFDPMRNFLEQAQASILENPTMGTFLRGAMTPPSNVLGPDDNPFGGNPLTAITRVPGFIRQGWQEMVGRQPSMSEDEWRASSFYRKAIPYDPGMTAERAAALAWQHDLATARAQMADRRSWTGPFGWRLPDVSTLAGQFAGGIVEPTNFIPIFGEAAQAAAIARFGAKGLLRFGAGLTIEAAENAANMAVFSAMTADQRAKYGDDVSWQAQINNVAMAAVIGAAFYGAGTGIAKALGLSRAGGAMAIERLKARAMTADNAKPARTVLDGVVGNVVERGKLAPDETGKAIIRTLQERVAAESGRLNPLQRLMRDGARLTSDDPRNAAVSGGIVDEGAPKPGGRWPSERISPSGARVRVVQQVVEADAPQRASGALQVRDTGRAANDAWRHETAANLDPARLMPTVDADRGAPLVSKDNKLVGGNHRREAISLSYDTFPEVAAKYRKAIEDAGFSTEGFKKPMLVDVIQTDMTPDEMNAFAADLNTSATQRMSPTETAAMDRAALDDATLKLLNDGPIDAAANRDFVANFMGNLPRAERGALVERDGSLNADGKRRIENALVAEAYGDVDESVLRKFAEATDDNTRSVVGAMADMAGRWASMRRAMKRGEISADFDMTAELTEALRKLSRWREIAAEDRRPVNLVIKESMAQIDLLAGDMPPETKSFIRMFYKTDEFVQGSGREVIAGRLAKIIEAAEELGRPQLFDDVAAATKLEVLKNAAKDDESLVFAIEDFGTRDAASGRNRGLGTAGADSALDTEGTAGRADNRPVAARFAEALKLNGGYDDKSAAVLGEAVQKAWERYAERLGVSVEEFEARFPLPVVRGPGPIDPAAMLQAQAMAPDQMAEVQKILDEADAALHSKRFGEGPEAKAAEAVAAFIGHEPGARNDPGRFGIMIGRYLEAIGQGQDQASAVALEKAFAPVREKLRAIVGDTLPLFRVQGEVIATSSAPIGQRSVLSFSADPRFAREYAGVTKRRALVSDEAIVAAEKELEAKGEATLNGWTFKKETITGRHWQTGEPFSIESIMLYRGNEHITDTDSIRDTIESDNAWAAEHNAEIDKRASKIIQLQVPLDDVIWASDRAGQMEFIVRNGRSILIDENGRLVRGEAPAERVMFQSAPDPSGDQVRAEPQGNLFVVHNLSAENLLHAARMGGLPMPSLAVARADKGGFEAFGEISLVARPGMIDPSVDAKAKTVAGDQYSPRYPTVNYEVDAKAFNKVQDEAYDAGLAVLSAVTSRPTGGDAGINLDRLENRGAGPGSPAIDESIGLMALYLKEQGKEVPTGFKYQWDAAKALQAAIGDMGAYHAWAEKKLAGVVKRERIFKGFTYSGNRRYVEHTLENVYKDMKARLKEGEGWNYGVASIRARWAKVLKSIGAVKKARGQIVSAAEMEPVKKAFEDRLNALMEELKPFYRFDSKGFGYYDDASSALAGGPRLFGETFENVPADVRDRVREFLGDLAAAPTEYFETKINRIVGLGEFDTALVPKGTSSAVLKALSDAGLRIAEYDKAVPGSRSEVVRALDAARNGGPEPRLLFQGVWHGTPHIWAPERLVRMTDGTERYIVGRENGPLPDVPEGATVIRDYPMGRARTDKMGTGEGAQAFGWGIYAADVKALSADYRNKLSRQGVHFPDGTMMRAETIGDMEMLTDKLIELADQMNLPEVKTGAAARFLMADNSLELIAEAFNETNGDRVGQVDAAMQYLKDRAENIEDIAYGNRWEDGAGADAKRAYQGAVDELQAMIDAGLSSRGKGRLFKVEIPENDVLLDWDKPLSQQPPAVKAALEKLGFKVEPDAIPTIGGRTIERWGWSLYDSGVLDYTSGSSGTVRALMDAVEKFPTDRNAAADALQNSGTVPRERAKGYAASVQASLDAMAEQLRKADLIVGPMKKPDVMDVLRHPFDGKPDEQFLKIAEKLQAIDPLPENWHAIAKAEENGPLGREIWDWIKAKGLTADNVADAVDSALAEFGMIEGDYNAIMDKGMMTGEQAYRELSRRLRVQRAAEQSNWTLAGTASDDSDFRGDRAASLALAAEGVPGLRYLDGSSRRKGEGSHNYVIFDGNQMDVTAFEQRRAGQGPGMPDATGARGAINLFPEGTAPILHILENADMSTVLHELGHYFLHIHKQLADGPNAPFAIKQDMEILKDWWATNADEVAADSPHEGVTADDVRKVLREGTTGDRVKDIAIDVGLQEQWARAFEAYLREGDPPTPGLRAVFEQFKAWLMDVYKRVTDLRVKLTPEVKQVMAGLFAGEDGASARAAATQAPRIEGRSVVDAPAMGPPAGEAAPGAEPSLFGEEPPAAPIEGLVEAEARVSSGPEDHAALREQFGLDEGNGFAEQADLDMLKSQGLLDAEDEQLLASLDEEYKNADAWGDALMTAARCAFR